MIGVRRAATHSSKSDISFHGGAAVLGSKGPATAPIRIRENQGYRYWKTTDVNTVVHIVSLSSSAAGFPFFSRVNCIIFFTPRQFLWPVVGESALMNGMFSTLTLVRPHLRSAVSARTRVQLKHQGYLILRHNPAPRAIGAKDVEF